LSVIEIPGSKSRHRLGSAYRLLVALLDILTLLNSTFFPWPIRAGILLLFALWIGGLLGAVVWRIRYRVGSVAANMMAALMSIAFVVVAPQIIDYVGWHIGGEGGWVYNSFNSFIIFVVDAAIFWTVLLAGKRAGLSMFFALLVSTFIGHWFSSMESIAALIGAWVMGLPVCIVAVTGREFLMETLPKKYFRQFCFTPRRNRKREIVDESYRITVGHVPEL
jgi:hypothetical protein